MKRDKAKPDVPKSTESEHVIEDIEGGDPGVTAETVRWAREANPEQAPGLPRQPAGSKPGDRNRTRRAGPSG